MQVQNITLQTSEVYLQQHTQAVGYTDDLTGTPIVSSKPIALFGGHQRTKLPVEQVELSSRDCLIEQIPPLTTWGKTALLTPYPQPPGITGFGSDIYRVIAAEDSTDIFYNGIKVGNLMKGGTYQGNLSAAAEITASEPILVAQYKKTSGDNTIGGAGAQEYGDPFMMIIPPSEQFLNFYRFINAKGYDQRFATGVYKDFQYATIITHIRAGKCKIRRRDYDQTKFKFNVIGSTGYSYAQIKTSSGAHTVEADSGVGLLVYGFGQANSYGYVGGMSYRQINRKMPELILANECFGNKVVVPGVYDGGNRIANIALDPAVPLENLNVTLPALPPTRDSAHFRVAFQDVYRDGACGIVVTDTLRFQGKTTIEVCGFTVGVGATGAPVAYLPDNYPITRSVTTGRTKCIDLDLVNYGKCSAAIQAVGIQQAAQASLTLRLFRNNLLPSPPDSSSLRICLLANVDGDYSDTLSIVGICAERRVIALKVTARTDKNPPAITKNGDPCCRTNFDVQVTEVQDGDSGIEFAEVIDSVNCSVRTAPANSDARGYKITVIDPYQDAFFAVRARFVGNSTIIPRYYSGFTMQFRSLPPEEPLLLDYNVRQAGTFNCDSLEIYNYGAFPLVLEKIVLDVNIAF